MNFKTRLRVSAFIMAVIGLLIAVSAHADQCGCTRESKEEVCIAYYELADQDFDVRVTCEDEPKYKGVENDES